MSKFNMAIRDDPLGGASQRDHRKTIFSDRAQALIVYNVPDISL